MSISKREAAFPSIAIEPYVIPNVAKKPTNRKIFNILLESCKESQLEDRRNICCNMLLTIIFIPTYTTSMIISELYFPIPDNIFHFILLKFIIGVSHQLLGPMAILLSQTDIRNNVVQVYRKGGTSQNTTMEMTYEELQRNLGLGVDIG